MSTLRAPAPTSTVVPGWDVRRAASVTGAASALVLALAAALGVAAPRVGAAGPALLVVAGVLGLPHGAVDHLALGWSRPGGVRGVLLGGYAVLAVGVAWVAVILPVPTVLALLVLSCAHFAEGELAFARLSGRPGSALTAVALGTTVVTVPLLLRPEAVTTVLDGIDPGLAPVLAQLRVPVLVLTGLLVVAGSVAAVHGRTWRPLAELVLVALACLLGPPLLVFAAWFGAWHAPRHLVRLLHLDTVGGTRDRVRRLARAAVLPTVAALTGLGVLVLVSGSVPSSVLVVLLALTVPHAAVVARLGRPER
ncbi:MAG: Brp/Blh family beta-carotene 15,15'-dioxygenase [Mycobacteriaceae bacterium]